MSVEEALKELSHREPTLDEELATLGDDDLFDMTNLSSAQTGIAGVLFISTAMGGHGPRVKYFEKTGKGQPSFSVSIAENPRVLSSSLPDRVASQVSPAVIAWVRLNRVELLSFWNEGETWMSDEAAQFISRLRVV